MRRCIVHFGMPKTGSSSIQATLFGRPGDQRLRYLHGGSANGSGTLATAFMVHPERFHVNRKLGLSTEEIEARRDALLADLERQLEQPAALYLISGESLSNFHLPDLRNLVRWLSRRVDEVVAVGYVRPPRGFMESAFQQNVKTADADLDFAHLYPGYRERFERMDKAFGAENVHYWKFDPARFPEGDVVLDFAQRIGVDLAGVQIKRVNEALGRDAVSLLYCFRQHGPGFGSGPGALVVNGLLTRAVSALGGPKLRFDDAALRPVIEAQREDLAWMESRLGARLDETPQSGGDALHDAQALLRPSDEATRWLAQRLGPAAVAAWQPGLSPEQVADWMATLRTRLGVEREQQREARRVRKTAAQGASSTAATLAATEAHVEPPPQAPVAQAVQRPAQRALQAAELVRLVSEQLGPHAPGRRAIEATVQATLNVLADELARVAPRPLRLDGLGLLRSPGAERQET